MKISVTIIAKNASKYLGEVLKNLKDFDEIILLDNLSEDSTIEIAKQYKNIKIFSSPFIGFGKMKNLAISYAKNDWIFSLDSDEVVEKSLLNEISNLNFKNNEIYSILRKNFYKDKWIKGCGWHPDYVNRIFNKNHTKFNDNEVHESLIKKEDSKIIKINGTIKHYSYDSIAQLINKMNLYTTLEIKRNKNTKSSPLKAITHAFWTFIRCYFLKKGFLLGYEGFLISYCNANGTLFKYLKIYENQEEPSVSLIITTYNQKERLDLVLQSTLGLNKMPNEILIADDGSKEDTKQLIESYKDKFQIPLMHIYHKDLGFRLSKIRNEAIKAAKSEYIIIIDGDMILEPNFIQDHLNFAKKGIFLQGSRVIINEKQTNEILNNNTQEIENNAYKKAFKTRSLKSKRCKILSNIVYKTSKLDSKVFSKSDFIKGIRGCNMSFFKSDCMEINGFNEDFIGWGREDSEFVARFLFNNGNFRRLKFNAIAYHIYHKENSKNCLNANHDIYLNTIKNKLKYCANGIKKSAN